VNWNSRFHEDKVAHGDSPAMSVAKNPKFIKVLWFILNLMKILSVVLHQVDVTDENGALKQNLPSINYIGTILITRGCPKDTDKIDIFS
jgi:hypothetical protein